MALTAETLFQALGDRTRLRLLNLMADGEVCVCFFVEILKIPQPTISRHLAYLRRFGLVEARRDGKWMHYSIATLQRPGLQQLLMTAVETLRDDPEMRRDQDALRRTCCSPRPPASLRDAPRPVFTQREDVRTRSALPTPPRD